MKVIIINIIVNVMLSPGREPAAFVLLGTLVLRIVHTRRNKLLSLSFILFLKFYKFCHLYLLFDVSEWIKLSSNVILYIAFTLTLKILK